MAYTREQMEDGLRTMVRGFAQKLEISETEFARSANIGPGKFHLFVEGGAGLDDQEFQRLGDIMQQLWVADGQDNPGPMKNK